MPMTQEMTDLLEKINSKKDLLTRSVEVRTVDVEKRSVEFSFSSEEPYLRWFGWEVLSHELGAMRMDRLKNNAPLLDNHNWRVQTGAVKSVDIVDKKGRVTCQMSRSARGEEVLQDMQDGIITNVSVGYIVHAAEKVGVKDGEPIILVTDWEPYEVSHVSIPADYTVGIGRSHEAIPPAKEVADAILEAVKSFGSKGTNVLGKEEKTTMKPEDENKPQAPTATKTAEPIDPAILLKAERERSAEIRKIATEHNVKDLAETAISAGTSVEDFSRQILDVLTERSKGNSVTESGTLRVSDAANVKKQFRSLGEQLQAVAVAEKSKGRNTDERLLELNRAPSGMSEQVGSDGGFLVQPEFVGTLLKDMYEMGEVLKRVRKIPMSSKTNRLIMNGVDETSRQTGKRWGGVRVYRDKEAGSVSKSNPEFRKIEMKLNKLTGICYATEELLEDAAALGSYIQQAFTEEFMVTNENEIFYGGGDGEMLGIYNSGALITVNKKSGQANDTFVVENAVSMRARLRASSRKNAVWFYNQELDAQLPLMVIGNQPVYLPAGSVAGNQFATLLGIPLIPVEYAQPLGTKGDISLFDLSDYLYADKGEMEAAQSIHVKFVEGENTFRFTMRNDGQPMQAKPTTPMKGGQTVSPFITLEDRKGG